MKTFTQYLAEAVKEIPVRIKLATDLTDDMIETIESELARYDVVNVAKPVKSSRLVKNELIIWIENPS